MSRVGQLFLRFCLLFFSVGLTLSSCQGLGVIMYVAYNSYEGWYLLCPFDDWQVRAAFERNSEGGMVSYGLASLHSSLLTHLQ